MEAAAEACAIGAVYVLLRLPYQIKDLFLDWLRRVLPDRAAHVESLVRQMSGGLLYDHRSYVRQTGTGPIADQIGQTFRVFCKRYGLDKPRAAPNTAAFRKPTLLEPGQIGLFG